MPSSVLLVPRCAARCGGIVAAVVVIALSCVPATTWGVLVTSFVLTLANAIACACLSVRAAKERAQRRACWGLMAAGGIVNLVTQIAWSYEFVREAAAPAVGGYLHCFHACGYIALGLGMTGLMLGGLRAALHDMLETCAAVGATLTLAWLGLTGPWPVAPLRSVAEDAVVIGEALVLITVGTVLACALNAAAAYRGPWIPLRAAWVGVAVGAGGAIWAITLLLTGTPWPLGLLTATAVAGPVALIALSVLFVPGESADLGAAKTARSFVAHGGMIACLGALMAGRMASGDFDPLAAAVLVAMMTLLLGRSQLMVHENRRLLETLRAREKTLSTYAFTDALTGLDSRRRFFSQLTAALGDAHRDVAVLYIDLDGFKAVNDEHGHATGDALLRVVADRLRQVCGASESVARLAGDEFGVIVAAGTSPQCAARSVIAALREPLVCCDARLTITASVGVAVRRSGAASTSAEELLHQADVALYDVKREGKNASSIFDADAHSGVMVERHLVPAIAGAIKRHDITPHFQPVVLARTGDVVAYEALARWSHDGHMVPPAKFVGIAERAGMLDRLTVMILQDVCALACRPQYIDLLQRCAFGINVGGKSLCDRRFATDFLETIQSFGLPTDRFYLEITETLPIPHMSAARRNLQQLRDGGVGIALDDLGTGYNSVSQLVALPLTSVKIDRSLVRTIASHAERRTVVHGLIQLAHHLDLRVVAEGVENAEQAGILRDMGADMLQGYYFGRPRATPGGVHLPHQRSELERRWAMSPAFAAPAGEA